MNKEKLLSLAKDCDYGITGYIHNGSEVEYEIWGGSMETHKLDKFAELIIEECMKQCQRQWYDENNIDTTDMNARDIAIHVGKKSGYIQCINSIKEHFGIKS